MDLHALQIFIQVAELGSFTRAGEKLGYSQPTVSFQIKQLEQELGVQLFERIGHSISLTDAGQDALIYAQQIDRLSQEMTHGTGESGQPAGVIHLAMAASLCTPMIVRKFAAFRRRYPQISLHITTAGTDELFRLLDHNEADLVCTLDAHIYNTAYVISEEEKIGVHFVCAANHPLAKRQTLTLEDLLPYPFLLTEKGMSYRRMLDEKLAGLSREIRPVLEFGDADLLCSLVAEDMGLSFLPDYVTEDAVRCGRMVRLIPADFDVELWKQLLYHRGKWLSQPLQAVIEFLSRIQLG